MIFFFFFFYVFLSKTRQDSLFLMSDLYDLLLFLVLHLFLFLSVFHPNSLFWKCI